MIVRALALSLLLSAPAWAHPDELEEFPLLASGAGVAGPDAPPQPPGQTLPMKPARRISFDTDEGTWISLDLSPDGKTIVFDLLGDLYTLPSTGGVAKAITRGMGFDAQPEFSPDGRQIAYISDTSGNDNVWIADGDGKNARQITFFDDNCIMASPAWSADGKTIYASRYKSNIVAWELWSFPVGGGAGRHLAGGSINAGEPREKWTSILGVHPSGDGQYIYFTSRSANQKDEDVLPLWKVQRQKTAGGAVEDVVSYRGSALRPRLSPDGRTLYYAARIGAETGLRALDLASGDERWISGSIQRDDQESMSTRDTVPGYAVSPDGHSVVLAHHGKIHRLDVASSTETVIPFNAHVALDVGASNRQVLKDETGPVRARLIQTPSQSPDGSSLAFSALGRIYIIALRGGTPRMLFAGDDMQAHPSWSADGKRLYYITWSRERGGAVWTAPADGSSAPVMISERGPYFTYPVPSPDGRAVIAVRSSAYARNNAREVGGLGAAAKRQGELVLMTAGGEAKVLARGRIGGRPHFGKDASKVHILIADKLHAVALDGSGASMLAGVTGAAYYFLNQRAVADDIKVSPDGRWLLAQNAQKLYLVAAPKPGTSIDLSNPGVPHKRITSVGADFFEWADDGRTVTWSIGSTFYRRPLSSIRLDTADVPEGPPDRVVPGKNGVEAYPVAVEMPRDVAQGSAVLRGATVITMRGDEVVRDADVVVKNNRIVSVGPRGAVPSGATVHDVSGKYIVPGFVDTHMHWGAIRRAVLEVESWNFLQTLAYGITSALDPSSLTIDTLAYQDMAEAGLMTGPRIYTTATAIFSFNELQSRQEASDLLSRYADHYRVGNIKQYRTGNRRVRQWVSEAAGARKLHATSEGALDMKLDLTQIIDGFAGNEHALIATPLYRDVIELLARTRVGYSPTLQIGNGGPAGQLRFMQAHNLRQDKKLAQFMPPDMIETKAARQGFTDPADYLYPQLAASAAKVQRAGGLVGVGSHGEIMGLVYHWELQAFAEGGMTPMEILRAATIDSAEIIGRASELGSLAPGKFADLVVLDADPLADIRNTLSINTVMKNGRLYDGMTLDEVWPRQRPLQLHNNPQPRSNP